MSDAEIFRRAFEGFGEFVFRPFDLRRDCQFLHDWVRRDYAYFWGLLDAGLDEVIKEYTELTGREDYAVFVGELEDKPAFVLERYDPGKDLIRDFYPAQTSDCGIHVIVAPPGQETIADFTWYVFTAINDFVFSCSQVERVLVEPDIRNKKMFAICERVGFTLDKVVELPHKTAQLAFCTRQRYQELKHSPNIKRRSVMNNFDNAVSPQQAVAHISTKNWRRANRHLVRKAIAEFSHERLITPIKSKTLESGWGHYYLVLSEQVRYEFNAKPLRLNHLNIAINSLHKYQNGEEEAIDAVVFIKELQRTLDIHADKLPLYLEEIISTLHGAVYKFENNRLGAKRLAEADFQTIEQTMFEGHPGFIANNGRIGFNSSEYQSYAPEAGNLFSLLWLAGTKEKTCYAGIDALPYETLIKQELDEQTIARFNQIIKEKGAEPNDYFFIPVHPWQWFNKVANVFSSEIADNSLICLGYSPDQYLAQQSIRTLFNNSSPKKFYVKSALSILNMGFMRGLPMYYLGTAPKMATWLEALLYNDPYLQQTGFRMLSEVASVSYRHPCFEELSPHNDFNKMLASLWRESPCATLRKDQKPMTMAALLHVCPNGEALLPELIKASGKTLDEWLQAYLTAYLAPMLHCFYHYDLVFMPHGENIILVMENQVPVACFLKDITEEAVMLSQDVALPEHLKRMYAEVPEDVKLLSIFTDIFDGFFRYMVPILDEYCGYNETQFWRQVAQSILDYQALYPQCADKFKRYDLFASEFKLSCLNRLQLNNHKQMIDLDDPVALLQFSGTLKNPISEFNKERVRNNVPV